MILLLGTPLTNFKGRITRTARNDFKSTLKFLSISAEF
jgi:hypothetical protein